ncbi:MAG: NAD(P)/FAD-dependent oxidoreductase [Paracoccaceae bacterium]|nr:MAG: NAD(P)/FAD-dependent oxidoreductase [Paracoccaceae bacterium]
MQHATDTDIAIVGGSFAGLSAALTLGRGRLRGLVIDHGRPRNRFADRSFGIPGQDGRTPAEIRDAIRADAMAYPGIAQHQGEVTAVTGGPDAFVLTLADGGQVTARRIILATGMVDILPDLPGLAGVWGRGAQQCPYCHGVELAGLPTGVLWSGMHSLHHARLLTGWTADLTLFTDGADPGDEVRATLAGIGVAVQDTPLRQVLAQDGHMAGLVLADGRQIALGALYLAPETRPASPLPAALGCAMAEGPRGRYVKVDDRMATSVPGVFAAGDLVRAAYNGTGALADGVRAAAATHHSLVFGP